MKVLQINVDGWFYGRPKYVYNLAKLLIDNNVDCKIVGGSDLFEKELQKSNIKNIRIFPGWKQLDRSISSIINLYKVIQNERPDLIHSHGISENIIVGIIGSILKIPVVVTYHTNPFNKYKKEHTLVKRVKRYLYELIYFDFLTKLASRFFSYITVVSKELQNNFIARGYKKDKIEVIYFGLNTPAKGRQVEGKRYAEPTIIFVGRVSTDKGCDSLLNACKIMATRGSRFKLYLIGDGDIDYFSNMAIDLGIKERVIFTGFKREISEMLMCGDMFVLPSKGEGLPISMLEAMSCGLPVIATNVGGVSEMIEEGKNGFLIPSGDEVALADAMTRMIEKGNEGRFAMGLENKVKIETLFSSKKMVSGYLEVYRRAVSQAKFVQ